jgi:Family of unknown function (DUF5990)
MKKTIQLHITLENPPEGVLFGLQKGKGTHYDCIQKQISVAQDLHFNLTADVKADVDGAPDFLGDSIHGIRNGRFIYINIGTSAGQINSCWSRRLKIPLSGITWEMLDKTAENAPCVLETKVNGRGKDGSPSCATVKPFGGWFIKNSSFII